MTTKRERLEAILAAEQAKSSLSQKVVGVKQPARYRNLMLNSHSTPAPSEVGVAPVKKSSLKRTSGAKPSGASRAKVASAAEAAPEAQGPGAPRDEWAVLGLFEAEVFRQEQFDKKMAKKQQKSEQRSALDVQRDEHKLLRIQLKAEAQAEAQRIMQDVAQFSQEEKQKDEVRRAKDAKVMADRKAQMQANSLAREADKQRLRAEEEAEIAAIRAQIEADKAKQAARKEADQKRMAQTRIENEKRMAKKEEDNELQKEKDRLQNEEYSRMLEQQEIDRENALKALYSKAAAKSAAAGGEVAAAQIKKAKDIAEQLRSQLEQKEKDTVKAERAKERKAKKDMNNQLKTLALQLKERDSAKAAHKEDMKKYYVTVIEKDEAERDAEARKQAAIRERNVAHRLELERQIAAKEVRENDEYMNRQELAINAPLLSRAKVVIN